MRAHEAAGYGAVAVVMADAWGEEATQHVRRGHIFGASCPSVAANICFGCVGCGKEREQNIPLTNLPSHPSKTKLKAWVEEKGQFKDWMRVTRCKFYWHTIRVSHLFTAEAAPKRRKPP